MPASNKFCLSLLFSLFFSFGCLSEIEQQGKNYQRTQTVESLKEVVALLPATADTADVRRILGTPIDMGFDYRYLTELTSENGCVIGAVFHIDDKGMIDDKWVGEICE